jgi:bacillithiol system protein YtxJ
MAWLPLQSESQLAAVVELSRTRPQIILKHSTRCSISSIAKSRVERSPEFAAGHYDFHLVLVVEDRPVSNAIASELGVVHESPQALYLDNGEVVLEQSHYAIDVAEFVALVRKK